MAIYRYQPESLIDSLQMAVNDSGGARAYLHAGKTANYEQLQVLQQAIQAEGWHTVPTLVDGEPVLEVRGFKKPDDALTFLSNHGWTQGTPNVQPQENDTPTLKEKRQARTLKFAGLSYNIGDISYLLYTVGPYLAHRKTMSPTDKLFGKLDIAGGIGYMAGSLALTRWGDKDQSQNTIRTAVKKIERYAMKEGIGIEADTGLKQITTDQPKTLWDKINLVGGRYPSEVLNSVYVGVGACIAAVSFYRGTREIPGHLVGKELADALATRKAFRQDVGLGMLTGASAIAGLTIKEKKWVEGEPHRKGLGRVLDFIQEKPLRATGIGFMLATLCHAKGTYAHWKAGTEKPIYLAGRGIFVATNLFSEAMIALSSKGHGTGVKPDESIDKTVIAATAEMLLRQPEAERARLIDQLAGYIASPEVLGGKADVIAGRLHKQIESMKASPWLKYVNEAPTALPEPANDAATAHGHPQIPSAKVEAIHHEQTLAGEKARAVG